jgi:pectin methylesterase-like acyl-CoA thioesterase
MVVMKNQKLTLALIYSMVFLCGALAAQERPLAFTGAEGFGKYTAGGRDGKVLYVDNLNDDGEGSFRKAIKSKGARTIRFRVSGTIFLKSALTINNDSVTILGQSAPDGGVCIANFPVIISANEVIIRYMRFRMGDLGHAEDDALKCSRQKNIIIDHCSMSWSTDECGSFYDNENFTLQWCILSESLNNSLHAKGAHGYGGIWGGMKASFHHNLLAHHSSRNPRFCGARYHEATKNLEIADFRNNVIYNWGYNSSYAGENGCYNIVNNYYKPGPATNPKVKHRILEAWQSEDHNGFHDFGQFYIDGNIMEGNPDVTSDNWKGVDYNATPTIKDSLALRVRATKPFDCDVTTQHTAQQAYAAVLEHSGASLTRDAIDARIVNEVRAGTFTYGKNGMIDSQTQAGGWPDLTLTTSAPGYDIIVDRNGRGHFRTVQEAIDSIRAFDPKGTVGIFIRNGVYKEKIELPTYVCNVHIVGESRDKTIITYDDHANINNMGTFRTYTFLIRGNDVTVENLTVANDAEQLGQAVALHLEGDRIIIRNCTILGNQDTVYAGRENCRQYFENCHIEGTTDFIFGPSTCWFENCDVLCKKNSYITAASTPANVAYGYILNNCRITTAEGVNKVYLGRPWRPYAMTLFMNCTLPDGILAAGWDNWRDSANEKTARYMEYNNTGKGAATSKRVNWSKQLTAKEAATYTLKNVMQGCDAWTP